MLTEHEIKSVAESIINLSNILDVDYKEILSKLEGDLISEEEAGEIYYLLHDGSDE